MLKTMRDSFHHLKWILLAVVVAFVFGFVFIDMGMGGASIGGTPTDAVFAARVNGETITYNEYFRAMKNLEDMYKQAYGEQFTPEMAASMGLQQQVLQNLIDQRLLTQEAGRIHLDASPEEIREKLLSIPTFNQDGKFIGMELYNRYVTGPLGYASASAFEEDLGRDITLQKIESALKNSIVVSPKTADAEYRRMNENAKIRYVLLPASQQAGSISVTPAEVEKYYQNNQSKYAHGEQRQVRYLLADFAKLRSQIQPSEQELRKKYDSQKSRYTQPAAARVDHILVKVDPGATPQVDGAAKAKADALVAQLRSGGDFAVLARENSEDPSSSGSGGDMGWVEMGKTVEPFERAIFSIPMNTVSDPIRTPEYGYHIVRVTERRGQSIRPFQEVRGELHARMAAEMAKDIATAEMNRIHAQIGQTKPGNVQEFVALANDKVTSNDSGWFSRNDAVEGIGNNQPFSQWTFEAKKGDISKPIGTARGIAIPYLQDIRPAGVSSLDEIRQKVEADLRQTKAREASRQALAAMMAGAPTLETIAAKTSQPVKEASVSRQRPVTGITGDSAALVDASFAAGVGELKGPIAVGDGAIAFQVVEQKKVTPEELAQNRATFMETLRGEQARTLRASLISKLRKNASIEVNDEITRPTTAPERI